MVERFKKLYNLPDKLYSDNSPIIVSAGSLLKDTKTGTIIVQLKFQSVSEKIIKAVKISLSAYDVSGVETKGVDGYTYLDFAINNGGQFGSDKAIIMPDSASRSFEIKAVSVIMNDGEVFELTLPFAALPECKTLAEELPDSETIKQYKIATSNKAVFVPQKTGKLWMCTCGRWNSGEECTVCKSSKENIFSSYDVEKLAADAQARVADEKEKAEIAREKAEKIAEKKRKKNKKIKIIASVAVTMLLITLIILNLYIIPESKYNIAISFMSEGKYNEAIQVFKEIEDYSDSTEKIAECEKTIIYSGYYDEALSCLEKGMEAEAAFSFSKAKGYKDADKRCKEFWDKTTNRETIAVGFDHLVALKNDGTVVAAGANDDGQCNVSSWNDIIAISAGYQSTVGLKSDGTVVATGTNNRGQCSLSEWTDIVAVSAKYLHTVGLKSDGTVVAKGYNLNGQCDVSLWKNIVAVSAGYDHTVGLKSNGRVVATGDNTRGQCDVYEWTDIVAVSAGSRVTVGLKSDGTVVVAGSIYDEAVVYGWKNIVAVSAGFDTIGVKSDGTVICIDKDDFSDWKNIVDIACDSDHYYHVMGLKSDGTVVVMGYSDYVENNASTWTDIKLP